MVFRDRLFRNAFTAKIIIDSGKKISPFDENSLRSST